MGKDLAERKAEVSGGGKEERVGAEGNQYDFAK